MKCIFCKADAIVGKLQTCCDCLENVLSYQGLEIADLQKSLHEASDVIDVKLSQIDIIMEELRKRTSDHEYEDILDKVLQNPFNLKEHDIC